VAGVRVEVGARFGSGFGSRSRARFGRGRGSGTRTAVPRGAYWAPGTGASAHPTNRPSQVATSAPLAARERCPTGHPGRRGGCPGGRECSCGGCVRQDTRHVHAQGRAGGCASSLREPHPRAGVRQPGRGTSAADARRHSAGRPGASARHDDAARRRRVRRDRARWPFRHPSRRSNGAQLATQPSPAPGVRPPRVRDRVEGGCASSLRELHPRAGVRQPGRGTSAADARRHSAGRAGASARPDDDATRPGGQFGTPRRARTVPYWPSRSAWRVYGRDGRRRAGRRRARRVAPAGPSVVRGAVGASPG